MHPGLRRPGSADGRDWLGRANVTCWPTSWSAVAYTPQCKPWRTTSGTGSPHGMSPRPFTWTKTADEILNSLAGYLAKVGTGHRIGDQD